MERFRGSPRERGYDAKWDAISFNHRRRHPLCVMCEQEGLTVLGDDCDHIVPIEDGGERYAKDNRWTICRRHHNGLKRLLQEYARKHGMLDKLREWCLYPETRPRKFRAPRADRQAEDRGGNRPGG